MSIFAIWLVIVIVVVIASKKKSVNGKSTDSSVNRPVNIPRNNMGQMSGRPIQNQQQGRPIQNQQPIRPMPYQQTVRPMQNQQQARPMQNQQGPIFGQNAGNVGSTPYFNQNNQTVPSNRNFEFKGNCAARYEEWLEVPRGYTVVTCEYCGAENLVPVSGRKNYQCYFCWKNL